MMVSLVASDAWFLAVFTRAPKHLYQDQLSWNIKIHFETSGCMDNQIKKLNLNHSSYLFLYDVAIEISSF